VKTRPLGGTGILVSQIALGCGNFGGIGSPVRLIGRGLDREAAFAISKPVTQPGPYPPTTTSLI
jgi:hypothetical protein